MSKYLEWDRITAATTDVAEISRLYDSGYLYIRTAKNELYQTRSLRVTLPEFKLSSENRRVLGKFPELDLTTLNLPLASKQYSWKIHKLGKHFYQKKFGENIFTAAKIKALITNAAASNFNLLLRYKLATETVGYAICYRNNELLHYAYPFYEFEAFPQNLGMAMMLKAIMFAKTQNFKYCYLGSVKNNTDKYKLQFNSLEWFDGKSWQQDIKPLKQIISPN